MYTNFSISTTFVALITMSINAQNSQLSLILVWSNYESYCHSGKVYPHLIDEF